MTDVENFAFEADGQIHQITTVAKATNDPDGDYEHYGVKEDAIAQLRQARQMIRECAIQTVSAFRNFGAADVQEVNLKFGIKLGGTLGIPYITEGSAESNIEISVKCTFPPQPQESPGP